MNTQMEHAGELHSLVGAFQDPALDTAPLEAWLVAHVDQTDPVSRGHSWRVSQLTRAAAAHAGISQHEAARLAKAALLHDVGKILVPKRLLSRAGPLADHEFLKVQKHAELGARILSSIPALAFAAPVAKWHHERWDGRGYPGGLQGTEVPYPARFISVLDALDAMTSARSYCQPVSLDCAVAELKSHAGTQFDAGVVELVCSMELEAIFNEIEQKRPTSLCSDPVAV